MWHYFKRFKDEEPYQRSRADVKPQSEALVGPSNINETLQRNISNLLKLHPNGLWACVLPEKYQVSEVTNRKFYNDGVFNV